MRTKGKSFFQFLNGKARIVIFLVAYMPLLKLALSYKIEEPYLSLFIYLLLPLLGGVIAMLIYDKLITFLKSKKRYR